MIVLVLTAAFGCFVFLLNFLSLQRSLNELHSYYARCGGVSFRILAYKHNGEHSEHTHTRTNHDVDVCGGACFDLISASHWSTTDIVWT